MFLLEAASGSSFELRKQTREQARTSSLHSLLLRIMLPIEDYAAISS
jgi:hypothetical protein